MKTTSNIFESSGANPIIGKWPHKQQLVQFLHKVLHAPDDIEFNGPYTYIDHEFHKFVNGTDRFKFDHGWALIHNPILNVVAVVMVRYGIYTGQHYFQMIVIDAEGQSSHESGHTQVLRLMNKEGSIIYVSPQPVKIKSPRKKSEDQLETKIYKLSQKFRPLMEKYVREALADIKGIAAQMIKSGSTSKLDSKIQNIKLLTNLLRYFDFPNPDTEENLNDMLFSWTYWAVLLSAHHYFPREVGSIERSDMNHYRIYSTQLELDQSPDILNNFVDEIRHGGNYQYLSTLKYYLKLAIVNYRNY